MISDVYFYMMRERTENLYYTKHLEFENLLNFVDSISPLDFVILSEYDMKLHPTWEKTLLNGTPSFEFISDIDPGSANSFGTYASGYSGKLFKAKNVDGSK